MCRAGKMHFTLGKGMKYLKSIISHDTTVSFFAFVPHVLFKFCRKSKDSFSPIQQGVHPLPEIEKFLFSLNYVKRSFFSNISFTKSVKPLFYLCIYFKISSKILFNLGTIRTVSLVFFEVAEYELISER